MTKKELIEKAAELIAEAKVMQEQEDKELALRAKATNIECLSLMAECMLHSIYNIKPTTEKAGYRLAEIFLEIDLNCRAKDKEIRKTANELNERFDASSYIFATTHYDEFSNGYFFRRS